jgi:hypothetical protein
MAIYNENIQEIVVQLNSMGYSYPTSLQWSIEDVERVAKENDIDISHLSEEDIFDILEEILDDRQSFMEEINEEILDKLRKGE